MSSSTTRSIISVTRFWSSRIFSSSTRLLEHRNLSKTLGYRCIGNHSMSASTVQNPDAPLPSQPPPSSPRWILGIALAFFLPFAGNKWGPLLQIKNEVDTVVETIEEIADVVEKVAHVVYKTAENISDNLSEEGKLKKVVDIVEDVAENAAEDAHVVGDAIDKFKEVERKVESIGETLQDQEAKDHPNEAIRDKIGD